MSSPPKENSGDGESEGNNTLNDELGRPPPNETRRDDNANADSTLSLKQKDLLEQIKSLLPLRQDPQSANENKDQIRRSTQSNVWNISLRSNNQIAFLQAQIDDITRAAKQECNEFLEAEQERLTMIDEGLKIASRITALLDQINADLPSTAHLTLPGIASEQTSTSSPRNQATSSNGNLIDLTQDSSSEESISEEAEAEVPLFPQHRILTKSRVSPKTSRVASESMPLLSGAQTATHKSSELAGWLKKTPINHQSLFSNGGNVDHDVLSSPIMKSQERKSGRKASAPLQFITSDIEDALTPLTKTSRKRKTAYDMSSPAQHVNSNDGDEDGDDTVSPYFKNSRKQKTQHRASHQPQFKTSDDESTPLFLPPQNLLNHKRKPMNEASLTLTTHPVRASLDKQIFLEILTDSSNLTEASLQTLYDEKIKQFGPKQVIAEKNGGAVFVIFAGNDLPLLRNSRDEIRKVFGEFRWAIVRKSFAVEIQSTTRGLPYL